MGDVTTQIEGATEAGLRLEIVRRNQTHETNPRQANQRYGKTVLYYRSRDRYSASQDERGMAGEAVPDLSGPDEEPNEEWSSNDYYFNWEASWPATSAKLEQQGYPNLLVRWYKEELIVTKFPDKATGVIYVTPEGLRDFGFTPGRLSDDDRQALAATLEQEVADFEHYLKGRIHTFEMRDAATNRLLVAHDGRHPVYGDEEAARAVLAEAAAPIIAERLATRAAVQAFLADLSAETVAAIAAWPDYAGHLLVPLAQAQRVPALAGV